MRQLKIVAAALGLLVATGALAQDSSPFGITGFALPPGDSYEAAAWRYDGKQVLTVDRGNALLFWDAASGRLLDTMAIAGLPPPSQNWQTSHHLSLRLSLDGKFAAVSASEPAATVLIDLAGRRVAARLDRPALFWTAAGLVAGPRAGCTVCDFAIVDPATARATPIGAGFGDGRAVAALPDGSRFASVVARDGTAELVVWSTASWTALARAPLAAGDILEIGFDRAGARAFARQGRQIEVLAVAGGKAETVRLSEEVAAEVLATDLDKREVMTESGPLPFGNTLMLVSRGHLVFYAPDPRYGVIYKFVDGLDQAIGGRPVKPNTFPWQVELQYRAPPGSGLSPQVLHNCGGSLIRPGWVLTATHCFLNADNVLRSDDDAKAHTVVRAGSTELDGDMATFDVTEVHIRRCGGDGASDCFRDYDPRAKPPVPPANDVALLRIAPHVEPVVVRSYTLRPLEIGAIKPIRLPSAESIVKASTPVTMTGWGATSAANAQARTMSTELNRIDIAVVPPEACSAHHGFGALAPTVICAGSSDGTQLACKGDSGGPLVADIGKRPVLVGIVSWGSCKDGPAVYTRVAAFVPWINATIAAAEARK